MPQASSRTAAAAAWLGGLALLLATIGILGIQLGLLSPYAGFRLFGAGAVLGGLLTLLLAIAALLLTRGGADPQGRRRAWLGAAIGAVLVGGVLASVLPHGNLPAINDIATDLEDPPGRTPYPEAFVPQVRAAYPDLAPIEVAAPPDAAFRRALATAEDLGWEIARRDPSAGVFEATETSGIFRFVDDVTVRVRPADGGSRIDLRSTSRVGRGDLGANARRIRAFARAYRAAGG